MERRRFITIAAAVLAVGGLAACQGGDTAKPKQSFMNIGEFSVNPKDGYTEVRDGAGRKRRAPDDVRVAANGAAAEARRTGKSMSTPGENLTV